MTIGGIDVTGTVTATGTNNIINTTSTGTAIYNTYTTSNGVMGYIGNEVGLVSGGTLYGLGLRGETNAFLAVGGTKILDATSSGIDVTGVAEINAGSGTNTSQLKVQGENFTKTHIGNWNNGAYLFNNYYYDGGQRTDDSAVNVCGIVLAGTGDVLFSSAVASATPARSTNLTIDRDGDVWVNRGNFFIRNDARFNGYPDGFTTLGLNASVGDYAPILEFIGNRGATPGNQNAMMMFLNKTAAAVEVGRITNLQGSATNTGEFSIATATGGSLAERLLINGSGIAVTGGISSTAYNIINSPSTTGGVLLDLQTATSSGTVSTDFRIIQNGSIGAVFEIKSHVQSGASPYASFWSRNPGSPYEQQRAFLIQGNQVAFDTLQGSGNRIVIANSNGYLNDAVIGTGLSFDGTTLTASGGSGGSITGSGTSGYYTKWTGGTAIGNTSNGSIMFETTNYTMLRSEANGVGGMGFQDLTGTTRGYVYHAGTDFGLLYGGGWQLKMFSGGSEFTGTLTVTAGASGAKTGSLQLGTNTNDHAVLSYSGGVTYLNNTWTVATGYTYIQSNGVGLKVYGTGNGVFDGSVSANASTGYLLGGVTALFTVGSYHTLGTPTGENAIYLGGTGDPGNYYYNTLHRFSSIGGSSTYAEFTSSGLDVTGSVTTSGDLTIGTDKLFVDVSAGKVGIGTTSPTTTLSVKGTSSNGINVIGVGTTAYRCYLGLNASNHGYLYVDDSSGQNGSLIHSVGNSYISGGNLGIGTTTPGSKLDVNGNVNVTGDLTVTDSFSVGTTNTSPTSAGFHFGYGAVSFSSMNNNGSSLYLNVGDTSGATTYTDEYNINVNQDSVIDSGGANRNVDLFCQNAIKLSTTSTGIAVTGTITATGDITAFYTSDRRLKDNIVAISKPLEKLSKLGGYFFDWNSKSDYEGNDIGLIAQEVEGIIPTAVVDRDTGFKAVRYEKVIPLLVASVNTVADKVERLEKELAELREQL